MSLGYQCACHQFAGLTSLSALQRLMLVVNMLQELVRYLQQDGQLERQDGVGLSQPPNLDQLIALLQRSQVGPDTAMSLLHHNSPYSELSQPSQGCPAHHHLVTWMRKVLGCPDFSYTLP